MKALVTGSTGFLGKNLVEELVHQGWSVFVLHRKSSDTRFYDRWNVEFIEGDITDFSSLTFPKVDCVFHTAGDSSLWSGRNKLQSLINVDGTRNVAMATVKAGVRRFICTSTAYVWGLEGHVIHEKMEKKGHHSSINFIKSRLYAEQEALRLLDKGLEPVIINPCHIMGPYDEKSWVQYFQGIAKEELQRVPPGLGTFCHAKQVARAHIRAFEVGRVGANYILGGEQLSYLKMSQKIASLLDVKAPKPVSKNFLIAMGRLGNLASRISQKEPLVTYEKARLFSSDLIVDGRLAENELQYQPIGIDKILADSFQWLLDHELLQIYKKTEQEPY